MYNVNTEQIEKILSYIDNQLVPALQEIMSNNEAMANQPVIGFAAERIFHLFIEGTTDVGNFLIDGFIMRDPGSYEDIVDIMEDEEVYSSEMAKGMKEIIRWRKSLVVEYTENRRQELFELYHRQRLTMEQYTGFIREYLKKELW